MKKQNKKKQLSLQILQLVGAVTLDVSIILASYYHFKHFYELLVIGMFLIFYAIDEHFLFLPQYVRLYKQFIKAGLIGDLLLGVIISRLWHYGFSSFWEYVPVYLIAYPFAGLVMVQTYVFLAKHLYKGHIRNALDSRTYRWLIRGAFWGTCLIGAGALLTLGNHILLMLFFGGVIVWALLSVSFTIHVHHQRNMLDECYTHPFVFLFIFFIVTYGNAFLDELPNVRAHEWIYTNLPLSHIDVAGIPVIVLLGWPFLTLYPMTAYYYLLARRPGLAKRPTRKRPAHRRLSTKRFAI